MRSGVVVAGGQSRRLGEDKRRLRLWGEHGPTLLEHTVGVLTALCDEVVVVLNDPDEWAHLPALLTPDVIDDAGSLGGIYAGLLAAQGEEALVVAADMPLLNPALLRTMLEEPRTFDALVPRSPRPGKARNALDVEPLHALYHRESCLEPLRTTLESGRRRIIDFLAMVTVQVIEPEELAHYDPLGWSFRNINTPEELAEVRRLIAEQG